MLAGDTQGFPNGRRLADDVVDIELRVVGGFLKGNKLPLGDGVDQNDVAVPRRRSRTSRRRTPASTRSSKRIEPAHDPTPAQP